MKEIKFDLADYNEGIRDFSLHAVQFYVYNRWLSAAKNKYPVKQINYSIICVEHSPEYQYQNYFFRDTAWFLEVSSENVGATRTYPLGYRGPYIVDGLNRGMKELVEKKVDITEFLFSDNESLRLAARNAMN